MSLEFYEVWAHDNEDREHLVLTTPSRSQAFKAADSAVNNDYHQAVVYVETPDGDLEPVKTYAAQTQDQV